MAVAVYVAMLDAEDPSVRSTALRELNKMDPESLQMATMPLASRTRDWLSSDDRQVQRLARPALELLTSQDPCPKGVAEIVIEALRTMDESTETGRVPCAGTGVIGFSECLAQRLYGLGSEGLAHHTFRK